MYVCNYTFALTVYVCMYVCMYVCILMPGNFCLVALLYWSFNSTHMFIDAGAGEQDIENVCTYLCMYVHSITFLQKQKRNIKFMHVLCRP